MTRSAVERIAFREGQIAGFQVALDAMAVSARFDGDDLHFMWHALEEAKDSLRQQIAAIGRETTTAGDDQ